VAAAWLDSTPCLFLSGQVKRADLRTGRGVRQMGFQEINIVDIVRPITKYAVMVEDPQTIRYHLEKAIYLAGHGRPGPVWLDIPLDVQAAEVDEASMDPFEPEPMATAPSDLAAGVAKAIALLNQSERPVVLAGNGVRLAGAMEPFLELMEILQVPVLTTWKALDFFADDDPLYIGRPGAVGQRGANFAQQNADFLLVLGARLDLGQTAYNHGGLARAARKVVVDVDPAEIAKLQMTVDVPLCADARAAIEAFLAARPRIARKERNGWWTTCRRWKARFPVFQEEYWNQPEGVSNYVLVEVLS
jgi:acetolactate synthase-1/2/3 large subunit